LAALVELECGPYAQDQYRVWSADADPVPGTRHVLREMAGTYFVRLRNGCTFSGTPAQNINSMSEQLGSKEALIRTLEAVYNRTH
jgi:hypothetical protein